MRKREIEGDVGSHWGIYDAEREPKFEFTTPVVAVPNWSSLAAISIGLSVLILALMFRDSRGLSSSGRGFRTGGLAITTFVVWLLYDFTQQYMTPAMLVVGAALFLAALGVIASCDFAEAHEWAEAAGSSSGDCSALPAALPEHRLPRVSIHVPAYNEPPDMLVQTLDALADWTTRIEVPVIDNNTRDEAVWRRYRRTAKSSGARFRFLPCRPAVRFQGGALNFALRHTDPAAEVVAVIDRRLRRRGQLAA